MRGKSCFIMMVITIGWCFIPSTVQQTQAAEIAHWKLDGDGLDSAGNNHLQLHGSPTFTNGVDGNAIAFNGINQYAEASSPVYSQLPVAVSVWFYISPTAPSSGTGVIFGNYDYATYEAGFKISYEYNIKKAFWATGAHEPALWTPQLSASRWYHIDASIDIDGTAKMYLDGVLVDEGTGYVLDQTTNNFTVGAMYDGNHFFNGMVDDLIIYNVPEPATLSLLALGGLTLLRRRQ